MSQAVEIVPLEQPCSVDCLRLLAEDVELAWESVSPFLDPAIARTKKLEMDEAKDLCTSGEADLWVGIEGDRVIGAVITAFEHYPNGYRLITILAMGGEHFRTWDRKILGMVEAWGRENGCSEIEIKGRKGWGRWFPEFTPTAWYYTKEL